ncbi:MAG TPA: formyl transferase [Pyrinomonadaceae bacterium]|nr:formyl transferase [Pyrinomonadaceae bacterium]
MTEDPRIVLLCSDGDSTRAVFNALNDEFGSVLVIMEDPVSRLEMARRRARRLGLIPTIGQTLFAGAVVPILAASGRPRVREIERVHLLRKDLPDEGIVRVKNVNSEEAQKHLRNAEPSVVVVNGTRIIGQETLSCVDAPFINTHAGITPLYRGVHGGYWALVEGKPDLVGTTVHLVDKGIDTGRIIAQKHFDVTEVDNFATYPYLHTAAGISILIPAVKAALAGNIEFQAPPAEVGSRLRHHPTIWSYVKNRLLRGVR